MLVQLSIEEVVLIFSASGPVKGGVSMEGWIKRKTSRYGRGLSRVFGVQNSVKQTRNISLNVQNITDKQTPEDTDGYIHMILGHLWTLFTQRPFSYDITLGLGSWNVVLLCVPGLPNLRVMSQQNGCRLNTGYDVLLDHHEVFNHLLQWTDDVIFSSRQAGSKY